MQPECPQISRSKLLQLIERLIAVVHCVTRGFTFCAS